MQCTNQLKQVTLACHNFHDTYQYFPSAAFGINLCVKLKHANNWSDGAWRDRQSLFCDLLPFIEQGPVYEAVARNATSGLIEDKTSVNDRYVRPWSGSYTIDGTTYASPFAAKISTFVCPSERAKNGNDIYTVGITNYRGNRGDVYCHWGDDEGRGPFASGRTGGGNFQIRKVDIAAVTDGTSNTVFFSETACGPDAATSKNVIGGVGNNTFTDREFKPKACADLKSGRELTAYLSVKGSDAPGRRWSDAQALYTQFFTILPPNAPSCANGSMDANGNVGTASSYHSGGVNVGMGDGAVKFVSDTINVENQDKAPKDVDTSLSASQNYGGPSIYGVWGALGSKSGGENVTLP